MSFVITSGPAHGTLSGSGATATYTPSHNYCGPDSFSFRASDGQCSSANVTVSITVKCVNDAPTCDIAVSPLFKITPNVTECVLLSCNNVDSDIILDASLSSDVEGDSLTFVWLDNGVPFDTGTVASNHLDVGTHIITLIVSDGTDSTTCTKTVTVIDLCEAVDELVMLTEQSTITRKNKKPLFEALKNACKDYEKNKCKDGKKKLESYQDKVRQHLRKGEVDAATANRLISAAQAILDGCPDCSKKPVKVKTPTKRPTKRPTRNN